MLRAVLALGGTAAGLVALLSFKTHPAAVASTQGTVAPSPTGKSAAPMTPMPKKSSKAGSKPSAGPAAGSGGTAATQTVTGAVENTQYGPMQVALTVAGKKITNVKILQQTNEGSQSQQIDAMAIPKLTSETLTAQSARIDAVSGATYTSQGYIQSLQSAVDKIK
jgi:uncharacterized protein with FMN-binding domain